MPYPHTSINISEELFNTINEWNLNSKVCMIVTNNEVNMVKEIELLKDNYIVDVCQQPCAMHTLQLSVKEGLKQKMQEQQLPEMQTQLSKMQTQQEIQINNMLVGSQDIDYNNKSTTKCVTELDDTNTIEYLPPTSCEGLLKQLCAAIYLSLDELWGIPDEVGLKASMLNLRVLKLLLFATNNEHKNTETQLHAELLALEAQSNQNNYNKEAVIIAEEKEYDSLSAELWGSFAVPISQAVNEDELTRYLKEQVAYKSQDPLM
ncbi:13724_t:CDS:2 [Cetraspora pellucida]|uniref:13724_t:CDS:1 n=1 Tax=Cetraspora pellucida TaxID=1433469 RepID=A0ACA9L0H2_9GLOM|nr:13724_t:CDS:2 [Cetraspora pellucida]